MDSHDPSENPNGPVEFPTTRPPEIGPLTGDDPVRAEAAIRRLCERYHDAIQAFFRLKVRDDEYARDVAGMFLQFLLKKNRFRRYERRADARFRNYLTTMMIHFLADNPPPAPVPEVTGPETGSTEDDVTRRMDQEVARSIYREFLDRHRRQTLPPQDRMILVAIWPFLSGEKLDESYEQIARRVGLAAGALRARVCRLRADYQAAFRDAAADLVPAEGVEDLTRYLVGLSYECHQQTP